MNLITEEGLRILEEGRKNYIESLKGVGEGRRIMTLLAKRMDNSSLYGLSNKNQGGVLTLLKDGTQLKNYFVLTLYGEAIAWDPLNNSCIPQTQGISALDNLVRIMIKESSKDILVTKLSWDSKVRKGTKTKERKPVIRVYDVPCSRIGDGDR